MWLKNSNAFDFYSGAASLNLGCVPNKLSFFKNGFPQSLQVNSEVIPHIMTNASFHILYSSSKAGVFTGHISSTSVSSRICYF
jgi:hypothetical protein